MLEAYMLYYGAAGIMSLFVEGASDKKGVGVLIRYPDGSVKGGDHSAVRFDGVARPGDGGSLNVNLDVTIPPNVPLVTGQTMKEAKSVHLDFIWNGDRAPFSVSFLGVPIHVVIAKIRDDL